MSSTPAVPFKRPTRSQSAGASSRPASAASETARSVAAVSLSLSPISEQARVHVLQVKLQQLVDENAKLRGFREAILTMARFPKYTRDLPGSYIQSAALLVAREKQTRSRISLAAELAFTELYSEWCAFLQYGCTATFTSLQKSLQSQDAFNFHVSSTSDAKEAAGSTELTTVEDEDMLVAVQAQHSEDIARNFESLTVGDASATTSVGFMHHTAPALDEVNPLSSAVEADPLSSANCFSAQGEVPKGRVVVRGDLRRGDSGDDAAMLWETESMPVVIAAEVLEQSPPTPSSGIRRESAVRVTAARCESASSSQGALAAHSTTCSEGEPTTQITEEDSTVLSPRFCKDVLQQVCPNKPKKDKRKCSSPLSSSSVSPLPVVHEYAPPDSVLPGDSLASASTDFERTTYWCDLSHSRLPFAEQTPIGSSRPSRRLKRDLLDYSSGEDENVPPALPPRHTVVSKQCATHEVLSPRANLHRPRSYNNHNMERWKRISFLQDEDFAPLDDLMLSPAAPDMLSPAAPDMLSPAAPESRPVNDPRQSPPVDMLRP